MAQASAHAMQVHTRKIRSSRRLKLCVQVVLNKMHEEGYCDAHRLPVGRTAAERVGTWTSCRSGSETIRQSTTSAMHGTRSLFDVRNIVEILIPVTSKKSVNNESAQSPVFLMKVRRLTAHWLSLRRLSRQSSGPGCCCQRDRVERSSRPETGRPDTLLCHAVAGQNHRS